MHIKQLKSAAIKNCYYRDREDSQEHLVHKGQKEKRLVCHTDGLCAMHVINAPRVVVVQYQSKVQRYVISYTVRTFC